jgi:hypothetical protein
MRRRCLPMFGKKSSNKFVNNGFVGQMNYGRPQYTQSNGGQFLRNQQPYPYQYQPQMYNWNPYQQQNPYLQPGYNTFETIYQPGYVQSPPPHYSVGQGQSKDAQFLFQNPLQPQDEITANPYNQMNGYPMMNPYPKQNGNIKQPGGVQTILNSFKSQDGTVDLNKMVNTAGQMMNAVSQVSSIVKGFGGMFKA